MMLVLGDRGISIQNGVLDIYVGCMSLCVFATAQLTGCLVCFETLLRAGMKRKLYNSTYA